MKEEEKVEVDGNGAMSSSLPGKRVGVWEVSIVLGVRGRIQCGGGGGCAAICCKCSEWGSFPVEQHT